MARAIRIPHPTVSSPGLLASRKPRVLPTGGARLPGGVGGPGKQLRLRCSPSASGALLFGLTAGSRPVPEPTEIDDLSP